jgi:hypothetical protein
MKYAVSQLSWKTIVSTLAERSFNGAFLLDLGIAALVTLIVYLAFRMDWIRFSRTDDSPGSGRARAIAILSAILVPMAFRLALLPWAPVPEPHINDEFSHLLVADTLVHGRLANPPHPLWRHLDTIYVLQQPAYASIYPIGQGLMLAAGRIIAGSQWFGVVLATGLMGGAVAWALLGCLPVLWAAAGGLLAGLTWGTHWMAAYAYFGGQFCALGGALLVGVLLRFYFASTEKPPSRWLALVAGIGWTMTWLTRPFESAILWLLTWAVLAFLVWRRKHSVRQWIAPLAILAAVHTGA